MSQFPLYTTLMANLPQKDLTILQKNDLIKKNNIIVLFLEVRVSNTAARTLYANAGFREIGVRRGYYPAHVGREDAIVLKYQP